MAASEVSAAISPIEPALRTYVRGGANGSGPAREASVGLVNAPWPWRVTRVRLSEAARLVGVSRSSLYRALEKRRLSCDADKKDQGWIDVNAIAHAYPDTFRSVPRNVRHTEGSGSEATARRAAASGADVLTEMTGWDAFSTFSQAIEATDLKDTLRGEGPFTVFAPTNDAFAQLPDGALDDLMMQENREALETLLKHHVVQGERLASTAIPQRFEPMEGGDISARMSGDELILSGGEDDNRSARVIGYIPAENGVVHVIDSVLITRDVRYLLDGQQRG